MLSPAAAVVCALSLLGRSQTSIPIRFVATPPDGASVNAEAFLTRNPVTITFVTSAPVFVEAQTSCADGGGRDADRKLASIIAHEEWHLYHGASEEGAYLEQLTTLARLGASPNLIASVRQSMWAAVRAEKVRNAHLARIGDPLEKIDPAK